MRELQTDTVAHREKNLDVCSKNVKFQVFLRKLKKAEEKRNWDQAERLKENKPKYSLGTNILYFELFIYSFCRA